MKILLSGIGGVLFLMGCGNTKQAVQNSLNEPKLMRTWEAQCIGSKIAGLSEKSYLSFAGSEFRKVQTLFTNGECTGEPAAEIRYSGTFTLVDGAANDAGGKPIDYTYNTVKVQGLTVDGRAKLEEVKLCGVEKWSDQEVDLSTRSADTFCPLVNVPSSVYEVYKVDADHLYVAAPGIILERGKSSNDRVQELDKDAYFASKRAL